ncbi:MAG TPA: DUF456 domain-containing protein [Candidatus Moranbacteria bacterium]|nr:DUF456 domain-containing protein [Candidatus Moranbacteria bacterium]
MTIWEIIAIILAILGVFGTLIPMLPGSVLSLAAIAILFFSGGVEGLSTASLIIFVTCGLGLMILDYIVPILGAKFFGASKQGIIGSITGGIIGFFLFPPLGILLGTFLGAVLGEVYVGKKGMKAVRAAMGTLLGSGAVLVLQIIYAIWILIWILLKVF